MNLARSHSRWSCGLKRSGTIWFVVSSVHTWSFIRAAWNRCRWQNLSQRLWFFVFALIDCNHLKTFQCYFFVLFDRSWCLRCVSLCTARPRVAARAPPSAPSDARSARSGPGSASSTADTAHSFESVRRTFSLQKKLLLILEVCKRWRLVVFCSPIGRGVVTGSQMCGWGRVCSAVSLIWEIFKTGFSFLSRIWSCDLCWCMD